MSTDPFELVRSWFQAFNAGDLDSLVALYHDDATNDSGTAIATGRDQVRREIAAAFARSAQRNVRMIARVETGAMHAEWRGCEQTDDGDIATSAGYDEFWIENGRIRRQRGVVHPLSFEAEEDTSDAGHGGPATERRGPPSRSSGEVSPEFARSLRTTAEAGVGAPHSDVVPVNPSRPSRQYPGQPIVGVGAVIMDAGKVVLVKRRFEPLAGQWSLPGGRLELGETLEAGLAREMLEETGLVVEVGPVVDVFDRILLDPERKVRYHYVLIDYLCRPVGGRLSHGSDVAAAEFVDPADLDRYRLTPKAMSVIEKAVAAARMHEWQTSGR